MRNRKNKAPTKRLDEPKIRPEPAELTWRQRWIAEQRRRRGIFSASPRQWTFRLLGCSATCGLLFIAWNVLYIHRGLSTVSTGVSGNQKPSSAGVGESTKDSSSHPNISQSVVAHDLKPVSTMDSHIVPNVIEPADEIRMGVSVEANHSLGMQSTWDEITAKIPADLTSAEQPPAPIALGNTLDDAHVRHAGDNLPRDTPTTRKSSPVNPAHAPRKSKHHARFAQRP
jgi:hypothetical protein